jgi:hypothetical protein
MKKHMIKVAMLLLLLAPGFVKAQGDSKFGIKFSGFVKSDFFWDTRQTVSIREGHFLLFPAAISEDAHKKDINNKPNFNFLGIQSRLTGKISGPEAFGAKTSGTIEADFFGNENTSFSDVNGFRLRHAFVKLNWKKTELLFGQYWHPLFIANSFPAVISFNTGAPFQPFSRNPQIRITEKFGNFSIIAAACSQRDFVSPGGSSMSLRNSAMPDMNLQFQWGKKNDSAKTEFAAGLGGNYKTVVPRLYHEYSTQTTPATYTFDTTKHPWVLTKYTAAKTATNKFEVDEKISSYSVFAFVKVKIPSITVKLYGIYGQNLFDQTMIGGYGIDTVEADTSGGLRTYHPYNTLSAWMEIQTNGEKIQFGLFGGYSANLGTDGHISANSTLFDITKTTCRGWDMKYAYRLAPRIVFISGKLQLTTEVEYTVVSYATKRTALFYNIDDKGLTTDSKNVSNTRILFAVIYNF